jgi:PAS domain S-box-containing protein
MGGTGSSEILTQGYDPSTHRMRDEIKTKKELIRELETLRSRIAELERSARARTRIRKAQAPDGSTSEPHQEIETLKRQMEFILGATKTGLDIIDGDFNIRYIDPEWGKAYGNPAGRKCYQFFHDRQAVCPECPLPKALETKARVVTETVLTKEGKRPIQVTTIPFQNEKGEWLFAEVNIDNTERKKAEEALRSSERRLADIINFLPDPTLVIDRQGRVIAWNQALEEMTGVKAGEILGKGDYEYALPFYGEKRPILVDLVLEPDNTAERLYRVIAQDPDTLVAEVYIPSFRGGAYLWGKARPLYDSQGNIAGAIESIRDITTVRRAEEALREREHKFRGIFEYSPIGIQLYDSGGRLLEVNQACLNMFGVADASEIRGFNLFCDPNLPEESKRRLRAGETVSEELVFDFHKIRELGLYRTAKAGTSYYFAHITPLSWTQTRSRDGYLVQIQDITERKLAEQHLYQYQRQLRSLASELTLTEERERRHLATDLHDSIGQALAISKLKLDSVLDERMPDTLAKEIKEVCTFIGQAILHTRSLTFALSPPILYELGLEPALESLVEQMERRYGLRIALVDDRRPKPLSQDLTVLLFRAVRELVINIIKHAHTRQARILVVRDADRIRIEVKDCGVGFEVCRVEPHGGSPGGFGLFSVRERLGHLGGSVEVQSTPGEGTRVILVAPLAQDGASPSADSR